MTPLVGRLHAQLLLLPLLCACQDPTQITIEVSTDVPCEQSLDTGISVGVLTDLDGKPPASTSTKCDAATGRIGSLVAIPADDGSAEVAFRIATSVGGSVNDCASDATDDNCIVSRRALRYLEHTKLLVPVVQRSDCIGVRCSAEETCVRGECVSARIDAELCTGNEGCGEGELDGGAGGGGGGMGGMGGGGAGGAAPVDPPTLVHGFSERYGGMLGDSGNAIAMTPAGHVDVAGFFGTSLSIGGAPISDLGGGYFIANLRANATHRWSDAFASNTTLVPMGLAVDADRNSYLVGSVNGRTTIGPNMQGTVNADQVYVAKFDSWGVFIWANFYGTVLGENVAYDVAVDTLGGVVVAGSLAQPYDFGGGMLCATGHCMFALSLDENGDHRWSRDFGRNATGTGVALDGLDNIYLVGVGTGQVDLGSGLTAESGGPDILLASFDALGNPRWDKRFGNDAMNRVDAVVVDASGNVTVAGSSEGTLNFGSGTMTFGNVESAYVASFDSLGAPLWSSKGLASSGSSSTTRGMAVSAAQNVYVATASRGQLYEMHVSSFDPNGMQRWRMPLPMTSALTDGPRALTVTAAGEVWVTGSFSGMLSLGGKQLVSAGGQDIFLLKLVAAP